MSLIIIHPASLHQRYAIANCDELHVVAFDIPALIIRIRATHIPLDTSQNLLTNLAARIDNPPILEMITDFDGDDRILRIDILEFALFLALSKVRIIQPFRFKEKAVDPVAFVLAVQINRQIAGEATHARMTVDGRLTGLLAALVRDYRIRLFVIGFVHIPAFLLIPSHLD